MEALSALDKNLATTLVMGVLRWQLVLQQRIAAALTKRRNHLADPVQMLDWSWAPCSFWFSIAFSRAPPSSRASKLARQSGSSYAVGLVNALLRKLEQAAKVDGADASAAHPSWLVERWVRAYGPERLLPKSAATTSFLLQPRLLAHLPGRGKSAAGRGTFVVRARRVVGRGVTGGARIQDEGSQLIAELAGRGSEILDCCAAPGARRRSWRSVILRLRSLHVPSALPASKGCKEV